MTEDTLTRPLQPRYNCPMQTTTADAFPAAINALLPEDFAVFEADQEPDGSVRAEIGLHHYPVGPDGRQVLGPNVEITVNDDWANSDDIDRYHVDVYIRGEEYDVPDDIGTHGLTVVEVPVRIAAIVDHLLDDEVL